MINLILKKLLFLCLFLLISTAQLHSATTIKILYKINDEIITSNDLENEKKFLLFLNSNLKNLSDDKIENISKNSLLNRKIKEIELKKFFDLSRKDIDLGKNAIDNYLINSKITKEFLIERLNFANLKYEYLEKNFLVDNLWRDFIYQKFKNQIKVDVESLKKEIENQPNEIEEINLSEILFQVKQNEDKDLLTKKIFSEIEKYGFEATASLYSISDSKDFGGKLGWLQSNQISKNIYSEIKKTDKITRPIKTNNGYLIIKINEKRKINKNIDVEEELNKLINLESNKELNKFGYIYFNKIKKKTFISDD